MANDLTAVQSDPVECGVWEVVDVVPAELLSEEPRHASKTADLRKLCRVTERIREPEGSTSLSKTAFEVALSVHKLAHQRLSTWHVRIVLDPTTANGLESPLLDLAFNAVEDRRIQLL